MGDLSKPMLVKLLETQWRDHGWDVIPKSFRVEVDQKYNGIAISIGIGRIWTGFIWNHYIGFFLVTLTGLASTAGIQHEYFYEGEVDAVGVAMLSMLTNISFKSSLMGITPQLGYMTILDQYVMTCIFVSFGIILIHAVHRIFHIDGETTMFMAYMLYLFFWSSTRTLYLHSCKGFKKTTS